MSSPQSSQVPASPAIVFTYQNSIQSSPPTQEVDDSKSVNKMRLRSFKLEQRKNNQNSTPSTPQIDHSKVQELEAEIEQLKRSNSRIKELENELALVKQSQVRIITTQEQYALEKQQKLNDQLAITRNFINLQLTKNSSKRILNTEIKFLLTLFAKNCNCNILDRDVKHLMEQCHIFCKPSNGNYYYQGYEIKPEFLYLLPSAESDSETESEAAKN